MQSSTTTAGHRKYVLDDLSRNVYLTVADPLVGIIRIEETVPLAIAFTMGGEISFGWGKLIPCSSWSYLPGAVELVVAPVPPSRTVPNQTLMETSVAQVTTTAQKPLRTGFFPFFFSP
jgi:hypothetical protein